MDHTDAILRQSATLVGQDRIADAIAMVGAALQGDPEAGALWRHLGLLLHRMERFTAARDALELASTLVPLDSSCLVALATSYVHVGPRNSAISLLRQLLDDDRTPTEHLCVIASGFGSLGLHEEALRACRERARRDPGSHEAHFGIAYYLRKLGHPCEAVHPMVARAHELAPDVVLYRVTLSVLLAHARRREDAYELIQNVDPRDVECSCCLRRMMGILVHTGDLPRAQTIQGRLEQIAHATTSGSGREA